MASNFLQCLGRSRDRPFTSEVQAPVGVSKSRTRLWRVERSADPFLGSPANFRTRAPNFSKLGQTGRARQDLVRKSESTTKCGDSGDESVGEEPSIRDSKGIRKSPRFAVTAFLADKRHPELPVHAPSARPSRPPRPGARRDESRGVTQLSRNGAGLQPILSEKTCETGIFLTSIVEPCRKPLDQFRESGRLC